MNVLRSIVFLTLGVSAKSLKNLPSKCLASELLNVGSLSKYLSENVLLRLSVVSNRNRAAPAANETYKMCKNISNVPEDVYVRERTTL
jgi:hypothetical protein